MAKKPANKILSDIMKFKKFKEESPDFKKREKEQAARERTKKMLLGRQEQEKAVEKTKDSKKAPVHRTRQKIAELAGLSEEQVRRLEFVNRYAPEVLARAKGHEKVSDIYYPVWSWYETLKKEDSDLFKKVTKGEVKLKAAYDKLLKRHPATKPVLKESPLVGVLRAGKGVVEEWIKEQHKGEFKPTAAERKLMQEMEALIGKYRNK